MHLTFVAAYQRNKIMFNNQTLQNIKIDALRSMFFYPEQDEEKGLRYKV